MKMTEKMFFDVLDSLNIGIEICDMDFNIIYVNKYELDLTYAHHDVIGKNFYDFFSDAVMEKSGMPEVLKTGKAIRDRLMTYHSQDGRDCIAKADIFPLVDGDKIVGCFAAGEDISGIYIIDDNSDLKNRSKSQSEKHISSSEYTLGNFIGESTAANILKQRIAMVAKNSANVLILGETGVGKEVVAKSIYSLYHNDSHPGKFVAFNCAAVPGTLLESILFGTVKGSFTGAENNEGLFEYANDGILFLDEINLMPKDLQGKLLRVIQERTIRRVGSNKEIPLNFKLIASSNATAQELLNSDDFRTDLFYRLNVLQINVPPLRERISDIPLIAEHFLKKIAKDESIKVTGFHDDVVKWMQDYKWPGNVRELQNFVEQSALMANGALIDTSCIDYFNIREDEHLESDPNRQYNAYADSILPSATRGLKEIIAEVEIKTIKDRLLQNGGNISKTARSLDLPKQTLYNKLIKYGLRNPKKS